MTILKHILRRLVRFPAFTVITITTLAIGIGANSAIFAVIGAMAFALGVAGLYGVISYSVAQRTREIGIRVAIGAQHSTVRRMFIAEGARLAVIGILCGMAAALGVMRLMGSLLFGVKPIDPLTYGAVAIALGAAAVMASYIPAMRATKVDPVDALRAE